jgi:hypothetical protein
MLSFELESTGADINIDEIRIENTSDTVKYGTGITQVQLYLDTNANGTLESGTDSILTTQTLSTAANSNQILDFTTQTISSSNTTSFLIIYDISPTAATIGATTNVTLTEINSVSGDDDLDVSLHTDSGVPISNTVTITGISSITVEDISPAVVLPGQTNVPMLYVSIKVSEEAILHHS